MAGTRASLVVPLVLLLACGGSSHPVREDEISPGPPPRRWSIPLVVGLVCLAVAAWLWWNDPVAFEDTARQEGAVGEEVQPGSHRGWNRSVKPEPGQELGPVAAVRTQISRERPWSMASAEQPWYASKEWYTGARTSNVGEDDWGGDLAAACSFRNASMTNCSSNATSWRAELERGCGRTGRALACTSSASHPTLAAATAPQEDTGVSYEI